MIQYIIQVVAFQLLFLVTYDLFLKKETFFNWNRVYLIFSSLISFLLPFIKIESFQNAVPQEYIIMLPEIVLTPEIAVETIAPSWNWYLIIGIVVSSLLFSYKIVQLVQLKLKGIIIHKGNYKIIEIPNSTLAFSIFNYVFIGQEIEATKLEDILSHELVHIREKHSLDLLYFELLRILFWFNPLVYIYQKRISEVHEYIADATIVKENNTSDYYEKLLAEVFQTQHFSFTNQFFKHSLIKKRIIMLTKQKSREILKLKYLLLIPVLLITLLYTSCNDGVEIDVDENVSIAQLEAKVENARENFNAHSLSTKGVKILSEKQYNTSHELSDLMLEAQLALEIAKGNKPFKIPIEDRTYEDYVKARKADMLVVDKYEVIERESISFKILDKAPVFPECEGETTIEGLKECFKHKISSHITKNFNMKLAGSLGLVGTVKFYTKFIINEKGEVSGVFVRAPHSELENEIKRVLRLLPKAQPGVKDGKPVKVSYSLPISFKIHQ